MQFIRLISIHESCHKIQINVQKKSESEYPVVRKISLVAALLSAYTYRALWQATNTARENLCENKINEGKKWNEITAYCVFHIATAQSICKNRINRPKTKRCNPFCVAILDYTQIQKYRYPAYFLYRP